MNGQSSPDKPTIRTQLRSLVIFGVIIVGAAAAAALIVGTLISQGG